MKLIPFWTRKSWLGVLRYGLPWALRALTFCWSVKMNRMLGLPLLSSAASFLEQEEKLNKTEAEINEVLKIIPGVFIFFDLDPLRLNLYGNFLLQLYRVFPPEYLETMISDLLILYPAGNTENLKMPEEDYRLFLSSPLRFMV